MLQKMGLAFGSCPLCSAEISFKMVGLQKNIVRCSSCKAEWASRQLMNDEDLKGLTLLNAGRNKPFKALVGHTRTVAWWNNVLADPRSNKINEIVNKLLVEAFTRHEKDPIAYEKAMAELDQLSPLGQAEIEGIADGIHSGGYQSQEKYIALWYLARREDDRWLEVFDHELDSQDVKVRQSAIQMAMFLISQTGNKTLLPKIIDRLARDESVLVRAAAAASLSAVGPDPLVIDALQVALKDTASPPTDPIVAGSLAGMVVAAAKAKPKASVGQNAWYSLASIDDPRAAEIAVRYVVVRYDVFSSDGVRNIIKAIENMGERAIKPLLSFFQSDPRARKILLAIENIDKVRFLINLLNDTEPIIRRNAASALEKIGDPRAIESLQKLAQEEKDPDASKAVAQALASLQKD